ncbi:MAG: colanic acid biosynthesis acetyltransferase WcaF [Thiotrichales bacterium]|jgi:putative colanic acid biosynthesis acetyltransferase WcaF|nr:colanic acid biosynthesis acetyltransferase WcaF [Thiotrichales bacterium]
MVQDLQRFKLPDGFRGRPAWFVQLWWLVQATLFKPSPQFMYGWRRFLLRVFGARVGKDVLIRPSVTVTYPWKLTIGDHAWIGDDVVLYTLSDIVIGSNTVISQKGYLCAGSHDYTQVDFPMIANAGITIGDEVWLAADVFVAPGVTIASGCVVGARSNVFSDLPARKVCLGSPARVVKDRNAAT